MTRPNSDTASGRAYLGLQTRARRENRPTDELLVLYVLERFLYRLSISRHRGRLVLKGGMLLSAFDLRRPTRDIDLLAKAIGNDVDTIADLIGEIVTIQVDDGVVYDPALLKTDIIREQDSYSAVRITVPARIDRARHPLRVDLNVGDPVTPSPAEIEYPALLDTPFTVLGYPIETVLAEKLVTMVERGDTNTRDRDFADVLLLMSRQSIDADRLGDAVRATADHRRVALRPLAGLLRTVGSRRQSNWQRFNDRSGLKSDLPSSYDEAIHRIIAFADPILTGAVDRTHWDHREGRWRPQD